MFGSHMEATSKLGYDWGFWIFISF